MTALDRKYAMTKMRRGDYLLPSNDGKWLWRIYSYEEDGSAELQDGTTLTGMFWACARRPFPRGTLMELDSWEEWEFWSGLMDTRNEAIQTAMIASVVAP